MYAGGYFRVVLRSKFAASQQARMSVHAAARLNTEPHLIHQARNGDADAFAALYETHKPRIQAVCLRMTNNVTEAEDLAQDAFIYVFRKISTFRGDSAFSTWIHRVTVNTVLMHFRRKGKRQVSLDHPHPEDSDRPKPEYGRVDERLACMRGSHGAGARHQRAFSRLPHDFYSAPGEGVRAQRNRAPSALFDRQFKVTASQGEAAAAENCWRSTATRSGKDVGR